MARWWKAFETKEARTEWEKQEKQEEPRFRVCMRMTAAQLEKDMHMPKGNLAPNKYVTVYMYTRPEKGERL